MAEAEPDRYELSLQGSAGMGASQCSRGAHLLWSPHRRWAPGCITLVHHKDRLLQRQGAPVEHCEALVCKPVGSIMGGAHEQQHQRMYRTKCRVPSLRMSGLAWSFAGASTSLAF